MGDAPRFVDGVDLRTTQHVGATVAMIDCANEETEFVTSLRYQLTLQAQLLKASKLIDRQVEVMEDQARSLAQEQETGPPGLSVTKQNLNRGSTLPNNGWHALQHRFDNNWSLFLEKTLFFRISGNRYLPVFECSYFFSESDPYKNMDPYKTRTKICGFQVEFWGEA